MAILAHRRLVGIGQRWGAKPLRRFIRHRRADRTAAHHDSLSFRHVIRMTRTGCPIAVGLFVCIGAANQQSDFRLCASSILGLLEASPLLRKTLTGPYQESTSVSSFASQPLSCFVGALITTVIRRLGLFVFLILRRLGRLLAVFRFVLCRKLCFSFRMADETLRVGSVVVFAPVALCFVHSRQRRAAPRACLFRNTVLGAPPSFRGIRLFRDFTGRQSLRFAWHIGRRASEQCNKNQKPDTRF